MDRRVTLLLFLSLLFSGARASVVSLSLKESEQRFSEHNLEVIAERYNIDIAEAQVVQAKLFENPVVSLEQNVYNRLNGHYFDFGKQGETIIEVEQLIYIAGQRNKRVRLPIRGSIKNPPERVEGEIRNALFYPEISIHLRS